MRWACEAKGSNRKRLATGESSEVPRAVVQNPRSRRGWCDIGVAVPGRPERASLGDMALPSNLTSCVRSVVVHPLVRSMRLQRRSDICPPSRAEASGGPEGPTHRQGTLAATGHDLLLLPNSRCNNINNNNINKKKNTVRNHHNNKKTNNNDSL